MDDNCSPYVFLWCTKFTGLATEEAELDKAATRTPLKRVDVRNEFESIVTMLEISLVTKKMQNRFRDGTRRLRIQRG
jgi:hypothetical protein